MNECYDVESDLFQICTTSSSHLFLCFRMGQNMNEGVRYFKDVLFGDFRCLPCLEFAIIGS